MQCMHSLSVANQTEEDTQTVWKSYHAVSMKLEIYAQTFTKYINLQAECVIVFFFGSQAPHRFYIVHKIWECPRNKASYQKNLSMFSTKLEEEGVMHVFQAYPVSFPRSWGWSPRTWEWDPTNLKPGSSECCQLEGCIYHLSSALMPELQWLSWYEHLTDILVWVLAGSQCIGVAPGGHFF